MCSQCWGGSTTCTGLSPNIVVSLSRLLSGAFSLIKESNTRTGSTWNRAMQYNRNRRKKVMHSSKVYVNSNVVVLKVELLFVEQLRYQLRCTVGLCLFAFFWRNYIRWRHCSDSDVILWLKSGPDRCKCAHARMHASTHARTHARTHSRTHACTHAHTHTHTHTYTYTHILPWKG